MVMRPSVAGQRLIGVADQVVENLLELPGIERRGWQGCGEIELDGDFAGFEFGFQQAQRFVQQRVDVLAFAARHGRPDGVQELFEDGVQPLDLAAGGGEVFLERFAVAGREFAQLAAEQLEVDVERIERVADLMGDPGGEQGERVEALGFQRFLGLRAGAGEVAHQHHIAERLAGGFRRHRWVRDRNSESGFPDRTPPDRG